MKFLLQTTKHKTIFANYLPYLFFLVFGVNFTTVDSVFAQDTSKRISDRNTTEHVVQPSDWSHKMKEFALSYLVSLNKKSADGDVPEWINEKLYGKSFPKRKNSAKGISNTTLEIPSDYKVSDPVQNYRTYRNPRQEYNFSIVGVPIYAGDINGDGINDYLYSTSSARDERTVDNLEDATAKTAVYFGKATLTTYGDQLFYEVLTPVGDINSDGYSDAIGSDGSIYAGGSSGYQKSSFSVDILNTANIIGFSDVNGDGIDDFIHFDDGYSSGSIKLFMGATDFNIAESLLVLPTDVGFRYAYYTISDHDGDDKASIFKAGLSGPNEFTIQRMDVDANLILQTSEQFLADDRGLISGTFDQVQVADIDGDGFSELMITRLNASSYVFSNKQDSSRYSSTPFVFEEDDLILVGDLNDDGRADFYSWDDGNEIRYISFGPANLNDGTSFDVELPFEEYTYGIAGISSYGGFGDITGDGKTDMVLSLTDYPANELGMRVVSLEGETSPVISDVRLSREYLRNQVFDINNIGDFNADGIDDFAVIYYDLHRVAIYFGGSEISEEPNLILSEEGSYFPIQSGTGDYNGDGISDFVVAFEGLDRETSNLVIYFGSQSGAGTNKKKINVSDVLPDVTESIYGFQSVANAGDVNNDGFDDIIASTPFVRNETDTEKKIYLVLGGNDVGSEIVVIDYTNKIDRAYYFYLGYNVAGVGDFNGDGVDDFAIGLDDSFGDYSSGRVDLYFGNSDNSYGEPDRILTPSAFDGAEYLFFSYPGIVGNFDYNGDSYMDVAVRSVNHNYGPAVFVYYGGDSGKSERLYLESALIGPNALDIDGDGRVDRTVTGGLRAVPDLNGDGADELLVTTGSFNRNTNAVIFSQGGVLLDYKTFEKNVLRAPNQSVGLGERFGAAVGDFNNDGKIDFIITQEDDNNEANQSSSFYRFEIEKTSNDGMNTILTENGWELNQDFGSDKLIFDIYFVDEQTGWLSVVDINTETSQMYKTSDGGSTWDPQYEFFPSEIVVNLYFSNTNDGWATVVFEDYEADQTTERLYYTSNGGESYVSINLPSEDLVPNQDFNIRSIVPISQELIFVSVSMWDTNDNPRGLIFRSTNGGESWSLINNDTQYTRPFLVRDDQTVLVFSSANDSYDTEISRYEDGQFNTQGLHFFYTQPFGLYYGELEQKSTGEIFFGYEIENANGSEDRIGVTSDKGATVTDVLNMDDVEEEFQLIDGDYIEWVTSYKQVNEQTMYMLPEIRDIDTEEDIGMLAVSNDGGNTWQMERFGSSFNNTIFFSDQSVGWLAGTGKLYKNSSYINTSNEEALSVPSNYELLQNYPNPFNPSTVISYSLPEVAVVRLRVYDMMGRQVASLVNESMPAGEHRVTFDAAGLSSGMYIYRLDAGTFSQTKKLMLIK